jgi:hypothetical protein
MTTIYDIIKKRKALEVYARLNGLEISLPKNKFSAHTKGDWGRDKRSTHINKMVALLYHADIKKMFPDLTKVKLKQMLVDFTKQNVDRIVRRDKREEDLFNRKCRRLFPLPNETYKEISELGAIWADVVHAITKLKHSTYVQTWECKLLKPKTRETFYRIDERRYKKLTEKERLHA